MTYLIEVPVEGGGRLVVQASADELPGDLGLAAPRPGRIVAQAAESLEAALAKLKPAIRAVRDEITAAGPDEATVEFGLTVGAEAGMVVAKGTGEVHFAVTLTWRRTDQAAADGA